MPLNTGKTRKDIERTLADVDKTPLYAVMGATDLAVEKIRAARFELSTRASQFDAKTLRDQAQATVTHRIASVQDDVKSAPEQVKNLPGKAQAALGEAVATALTAYGDLAGRGKGLVTRVRRQQATADLTDQAKSTVARAKSTKTTVKKQSVATKQSATATARQSASETAETAKGAASRTKTSAKATTTSVKKTATAAKKAAAVTASKVGD